MAAPQQLMLQLPPRGKHVPLRVLVLEVMQDAQGEGRWLAPFEVQHIVNARWGCFHSESTISARMRGVRGKKNGPGFVVERRSREGKPHIQEYLITGWKQ